jgi:uncharacterized protein YabN with tetrapyrrole methylase and pyrophosphatase domain
MAEQIKTSSEPQGTLACVGLGMTLGAHITPITEEHIRTSDVCFVAASDALVELWVSEMHDDVRSLQEYYSSDQSRQQTYKNMIEAVLTELRTGKRVVGIFYGHPGVFAYVPHQLVKQARTEGFSAIMEPGISAEDCLIADLGIDPGRFGCQQYEASQYLFYHRVIDPSAYLILWQIGVVGDLNYGIEVTSGEYRRLLLELLYTQYSKEHPIILYEAATVPIQKHRAEEIPLHRLIEADLKDYTTLVIPPAHAMKKNLELIERIKAISLID